MHINNLEKYSETEVISYVQYVVKQRSFEISTTLTSVCVFVSPDLYVKLYVVNIATQKRIIKKKTRVCRHDREPSFNETFRFCMNPTGHALQVTHTLHTHPHPPTPKHTHTIIG